MCFLFIKNKIPDSCDLKFLAAFRHNCHDEGILNALSRRCVQTFAELSDLVSRFRVMEDAWLDQKEQRDSISTEVADHDRQ